MVCELTRDQLLPLAAVSCQDVVLHVGQDGGELLVLPADGGLQLLQLHPAGGQRIQHLLTVSIYMLPVELQLS